ncbi:hypothetical protein RJK59_004295 [Salmonella enterica]|nr:hypothetical protein [Salmonella enterica]EEJ9028867.1 hypothetical protein [Salmonella enterica subsp. enterica]ELC5052882.1 hypothetical protein [Salmonella enterica]
MRLWRIPGMPARCSAFLTRILKRELERGTLKSLSTVAGWLSNKSDAPTLSLEKTLFDIEVSIDGENGYVLPDFIVMATMGSAWKTENILR